MTLFVVSQLQLLSQEAWTHYKLSSRICFVAFALVFLVYLFALRIDHREHGKHYCFVVTQLQLFPRTHGNTVQLQLFGCLYIAFPCFLALPCPWTPAGSVANMTLFCGVQLLLVHRNTTLSMMISSCSFLKGAWQNTALCCGVQSPDCSQGGHEPLESCVQCMSVVSQLQLVPQGT